MTFTGRGATLIPSSEGKHVEVVNNSNVIQRCGNYTIPPNGRRLVPIGEIPHPLNNPHLTVVSGVSPATLATTSSTQGAKANLETAEKHTVGRPLPNYPGWEGFPGQATYTPGEGMRVMCIWEYNRTDIEESEGVDYSIYTRPLVHNEEDAVGLSGDDYVAFWQCLKGILDFRPHLIHTDCELGRAVAERCGIPHISTLAKLSDYETRVYPVTDILVIAYNEYQVTKLCIEHIVAHTWAPYRLLLLNNGSTDKRIGTLFRKYERLLGKKQCQVFEVQDNLGCPKGRNYLAAQSDAPYIFVLDNDMLVPPGWLRPLVDFMRKNPQAGAIAPWWEGYGARLRGTGIHQEAFHASNALYRREAFGEGYAEPFCSLQGRSDTDLNWRLLADGWEIYIHSDVEMYHLGGALMGEQGFTRRKGDMTNFLTAENVFRRKWVSPGVLREKADGRYRLMIYVPNVFWGGMQVFSTYLARYLPEDEFQIYFAVLNYNEAALADLKRYGVVNVIKQARNIDDIRAQLARFIARNGIDVVQNNSFVMAEAARMAKVPSVSTIHSISGARQAGAGIADITVRVSDAVEYDCPVVLNGVDVLARDERAHRKREIVYIGRFARDRRPDIFIEAIHILRQSNLGIHGVMIGGGRDEDMDVRGLIGHYGLESAIEIAGLLPHQEAIARMAMGGVVCAPFPEGFGLGIAEGMGAGLIPVVSDKGYGPMMVEGVGMTASPTAEELAASINEAVNISCVTRRRAAIHRAREHYSAQRFADEYAELYRSLL